MKSSEQYWKRRLGDEDFEKRWQKALHDGLVSETRAKPREVTWSFADRMPDSTPLTPGSNRARNHLLSGSHDLGRPVCQ